MYQPVLFERKKKKPVRLNKQIENLAYVFTLPIISFGLWNDVPKNIKEAITFERMFSLMKDKGNWKKFREEATDVEAMWYPSSASMEAPLDHEWTQIFSWLFRNWCRTWHPEGVPDFVADEPEELDSYLQAYLLIPLKQRIRRKQLQIVKGR